MKQYLLIPISEIDSRIEELSKFETHPYNKSLIEELNRTKSKGEIIEINNDILNDLFYEYSHSNTKQTFESFVVNEKGYKLIKIIKQ